MATSRSRAAAKDGIVDTTTTTDATDIPGTVDPTIDLESARVSILDLLDDGGHADGELSHLVRSAENVRQLQIAVAARTNPTTPFGAQLRELAGVSTDPAVLEVPAETDNDIADDAPAAPVVLGLEALDQPKTPTQVGGPIAADGTVNVEPENTITNSGNNISNS